MRTRYFRLAVVSIGMAAAVASAQGPSYPPLPPLQPVAPPVAAAPVVPAGGVPQAVGVPVLPTPPVAAAPAGLPTLDPPPVVTPTVPIVAPTQPVAPVVPPMEPVTPPATPATKPESKISVTLGSAPTDPAARFDAALADMKAAYAKVRDYSCHLKKVERINGKLTAEQTAELHARAKPASVYLKFIGPREMVGMEACFVDGKFAGNAKFRLKPAGVLGVGGFQTMAVDDSRVLATNRHTIDHVGIGALIELVDKNIRVEKQMNNATTVTAAEYTFADRPVTRYELVCGTPHAHRYCYKAVLYVDKETRLPVRFEAYDAPKPDGDPAGDLLECYSYVNLKLNPGHGAAVFDR